MKEMLAQRKAELEKQGKKGFTLMEMLIVVAIIAVLVAIAIPVFMGQLEKSRAQTDAANIRSGYASAMAQVLTDNPAAGTTYVLQKDASVMQVKTGNTPATNAYKCQGKASVLADDTTETIGGQTASSIGWDDTTTTITYCWSGSKLGIGKDDTTAKSAAGYKES